MSQSVQSVADHYKKRPLGDAILAGLKAAGKDIERLTPDDLAPVDEFHSGGRNATVRLAQLAGINGSERVLDVGCGIGGPSRYLPSTFGCRVVNVFFSVTAVATQRLFSVRAMHLAKSPLNQPLKTPSLDLRQLRIRNCSKISDGFEMKYGSSRSGTSHGKRVCN